MDHVAKSLDTAVQQVFEGLLFLEANPLESSETPATDMLEARLDIQGAIAGTLLLQVSRDDSLRLLRCLPNPNPLPEHEAVVDLFAELVNTVGGRFAAALAADGAFDLSIPAVRFGRFFPEKTALCRLYALDELVIRIEFRPNQKGETRAH